MNSSNVNLDTANGQGNPEQVLEKNHHIFYPAYCQHTHSVTIRIAASKPMISREYYAPSAVRAGKFVIPEIRTGFTTHDHDLPCCEKDQFQSFIPLHGKTKRLE